MVLKVGIYKFQFFYDRFQLNIIRIFCNFLLYFCVILQAEFAYAQIDSSHKLSQPALSFGQFYYGVEFGSIKLRVDEMATITSAGETEFTMAKLILGTFYASGKLDSYIAVPLKRQVAVGDFKGNFSTGIEAGYRYYPLALAKNYTSPFIGAGLSFPNYTFHTAEGKGNKKYHVAFPIMAGYGFLLGNAQFDVGIRRALRQDGKYYFTSDREGYFYAESDEFFLNYKHPSHYASTKQKKQQSDKSFSGFHPFLGLAPSVAWFTQGNDADNTHPALSSSNYGAFMNEYVVGMVIKPESWQGDKRLIAQFSHRPIDIDLEAYGKKFNYKMESNGVEMLWSPFMRFGLAPFIGAGITNNRMNFTDNDNQKYQGRQNQYSWVFGWDILPDFQRNFYLRFAMRYQSKVILHDHGREIKFPNFEVNYINFVWQY